MSKSEKPQRGRVPDKQLKIARKGTVRLDDSDPNRRRFRFTYAKGEQDSLALPKGAEQLPWDLENKLRLLIEQDIANGEYDVTKEKYNRIIDERKMPDKETHQMELVKAQVRNILGSNQATKAVLINPYQEEQQKEQPKIFQISVNIVNNYGNTQAADSGQPLALIGDRPMVLSEELENYCKANDLKLKSSHNNATYQMLLKWGKEIQPDQVMEKLGNEVLAPTTYNARLGLLNKIFEWLVYNERLRKNPLKFVKPREESKVKPPERTQLYDNEINDILEAIRTDRFTSEKSQKVKHSDYYGIMVFLAVTGARPGEAIGLQVKKVDFRRKTFVIDEAIKRDTHELGETKTGNSRKLRFDSHALLEKVLWEACHDKKGRLLAGDTFVFRNCDGGRMETRNLGRGCLTPVLEGLKIPYRVPYVMRHSFVSRCIRANMHMKAIMALTGHVDYEMILKVYGEIEAEKVFMPQINKEEATLPAVAAFSNDIAAYIDSNTISKAV